MLHHITENAGLSTLYVRHNNCWPTMRTFIVWVRRKAWGLSSVAASLAALYSHGRYASLHWHGPEGDLIGAIMGENMGTFILASQYISVIAFALAMIHILKCKPPLTIITIVGDYLPLVISLVAMIIAWCART